MLRLGTAAVYLLALGTVLNPLSLNAQTAPEVVDPGSAWAAAKNALRYDPNQKLDMKSENLFAEYGKPILVLVFDDQGNVIPYHAPNAEVTEHEEYTKEGDPRVTGGYTAMDLGQIVYYSGNSTYVEYPCGSRICRVCLPAE